MASQILHNEMMNSKLKLGRYLVQRLITSIYDLRTSSEHISFLNLFQATMQLFVRGQMLYVLDVVGSETAAEIKNMVATLEGVDAADMAVYCRGSPLDDSSSLPWSDVSNLDTLNVELRVVGG